MYKLLLITDFLQLTDTALISDQVLRIKEKYIAVNNISRL